MIYNTIHINDSGAIEETQESIFKGKTTTFCRMYDDEDF
jgi:hypothetical protein